MSVLITGATGFVGQALTRLLVEKSQTEIHALVRSVEHGKHLLPAGIRLFQGEIENRAAVANAMKGCKTVYHLAALAGVWAKNPNLFYRVNVEGTRTVLDTALRAGVRKVVVTSTAGVMGPSPYAGVSVNESTHPNPPLISIYDQTKMQAEQVSFSYFQKGLDLVIVNPTRIYGPGVDRESNSVTKLLRKFSQGKWRIIPGDGSSIGNYVYIRDVARGHLLAMRHGKPGERYILGGENVSYRQLFELLRQVTGSSHRLFNVPLPPIIYFAKAESYLANITNRKPLLAPDYVKKLSLNWPMSSEKAMNEIGYTYIPLKEGLTKTYRWLLETDRK